MPSVWIDEDVETLRRYHANLSNLEVAQLLGGRYSVRQVLAKAAALGLLKTVEQRARSISESYKRFPRRPSGA